MMEKEPGFLEFVIGVFPLVVLGGMLFWMIRKYSASMKSNSGKGYAVLMEELVEELRRQNDLVEKMVDNQEERLRKLEDKT